MNSSLLTDLYQLTMAYSYWKQGMENRTACFHLFYRRAPFSGEAVIAAGTVPALEFLQNLAFSDDDLIYLAQLKGADGRVLFEKGFLEMLESLEWKLDVAAVPEGEVVYPHEPLMRITGPLLQCQLVETALLNLVNFQTLVATKAARICDAADGDDVLEFGLRRAQGPDGGLSASRAAYIGGCAATSNVLAGQKFGIPVKGTHAHSWVMSFETEQAAFNAYAEAMPNNAILLVDTYDTVEGVKKAIATGKQLAEQGHQLLGIRLDSGDLAALSQQARQLLDGAAMHSAKIVASNDLDEYEIVRLKKAGARIDVWGVGTKLVTAYDQPALGGVYKLGALQNENGDWDYKVKLSNDLIKVSNPGCLNVLRTADGRDLLFNELEEQTEEENATRLLVDFIKEGRPVYQVPSLDQTRERARDAWTGRQTKNPVALTPQLEQTKRDLLAKHGFTPAN